MKTPSDNLFRLIHSMSSSEKRSFKLDYQTNTSDIGYIVLFDAIESLKNNDEKKVIDILKKGGFKHNFKKSKEHLSKIILNFISEHHSTDTINLKIQHHIRLSEILFEKWLPDLAHKNILKAKELILKYEHYEYMPVIYAIEWKLLTHGYDFGKIENYLNEDEPSKHRSHIKILNNNMEYRELMFDVFKTKAKTPDKNVAHAIGKLNRIYQSPLLSSTDQAKDFHSLSIHHDIHNYYASKEINHTQTKKSHQRLLQWVTYLERDTNLLNDRYYYYLDALNHSMIVQADLRLSDEMEICWKKAIKFTETLPTTLKTERLIRFLLTITINYLSGQLDILNPEKVIAAWGKINSPTDTKNELKRYGENTILSSNLFLAYFMLDQFKHALTFANKIINSKSTYRIDIQNSILILRLLTHYNLGNYDLLVSMSNSTEKLLSKGRKLYQFEKHLLDVFKIEIAKTNATKEHNEIFKIAKAKMESIFKKRYSEAMLSKYFDFISWFDSKIQNRPMLEVMKEKMKKI